MLNFYTSRFFFSIEYIANISTYISKSYNFWSFKTKSVLLLLFILYMAIGNFYLHILTIFKYLYTHLRIRITIFFRHLF